MPDRDLEGRIEVEADVGVLELGRAPDEVRQDGRLEEVGDLTPKNTRARLMKVSNVVASDTEVVID